MEGRPHWLCLSISGAALFFVGKQVTQRAEPIIISINQSACCRTLLQQPAFLHACTQPLWWSPVENSGCGSSKRQSVEQQLNERYTRPRDLRQAIGCGSGILPIAFLQLSLTIAGSTSLWEKRPYLSQLATNSFEFHRVNLVT